MTPPSTTWEKEFDKFYIRVVPVDRKDKMKSVALQRLFDETCQKEKNKIKDFIRRLLAEQRKEIVEEIKILHDQIKVGNINMTTGFCDLLSRLSHEKEDKYDEAVNDILSGDTLSGVRKLTNLSHEEKV